MVQKLIEKEGLLLDTPFMQQLREEGRQEGRQEAWTETVQTLRALLLKTLAARFSLAAAEQQTLTDTLATVHSVEQLQALFEAALQEPDVAAFQATLAQVSGDETATS